MQFRVLIYISNPDCGPNPISTPVAASSMADRSPIPPPVPSPVPPPIPPPTVRSREGLSGGRMIVSVIHRPVLSMSLYLIARFSLEGKILTRPLRFLLASGIRRGLFGVESSIKSMVACLFMFNGLKQRATR